MNKYIHILFISSDLNFFTIFFKTVDRNEVKNIQISIDLIFDLLIRTFFGRGELTVCLSLLYLLVSESF